MKIWQDLVKTAVVGTQRQKLKIVAQNNQLDEVLNGLDTNDKEGCLLSAAGTIYLYQKAGKSTAIDSQKSLNACDLDDLPYCSQVSEQHLGIMLSGENTGFLGEWLRLLAETQKVVSPRYLPELLALGKRKDNLRKYILPILGKRGIWLAAQNPEWNYAVGEDADKVWKNGSLEARKNLLTELRQSNAEKGRRQLNNIWTKEKAKEKASLLEILQVGLSVDDMTFLEDALDDRSKLVRDFAARLLAQIPESKLVQRMTERVRPLLSLNKNEIEVELPKKCTLEMIQDGIDESKYIPALGEKASLLLQMLACVPPSIWSNDWQKTPAELINIIENSKWEKLFLEAWGTATVRSKDTVWAEALLRLFASVGSSKNSNRIKLIVDLLKIVHRSQVENLILEILQESVNNSSFNYAIPNLFAFTPYIWNEEVSRAVISSIKKNIESNNQINNWQFNSALGNLSITIAPSIYPEAAEILKFEKPEIVDESIIKSIDNFLTQLKFRFDMRQALLV